MHHNFHKYNKNGSKQENLEKQIKRCKFCDVYMYSSTFPQSQTIFAEPHGRTVATFRKSDSGVGCRGYCCFLSEGRSKGLDKGQSRVLILVRCCGKRRWRATKISFDPFDFIALTVTRSGKSGGSFFQFCNKLVMGAHYLLEVDQRDTGHIRPLLQVQLISATM